MRLSCDTPSLRNRMSSLNLHCTRDRVHNTGKLDQHAIAGDFDNAPFVVGNPRIEQFVAMALKGSECTSLICTHETTKAYNVCSKDGGQSTFQTAPEFSWK